MLVADKANIPPEANSVTLLAHQPAEFSSYPTHGLPPTGMLTWWHSMLRVNSGAKWHGTAMESCHSRTLQTLMLSENSVEAIWQLTASLLSVTNPTKVCELLGRLKSSRLNSQSFVPYNEELQRIMGCADDSSMDTQKNKPQEALCNRLAKPQWKCAS